MRFLLSSLIFLCFSKDLSRPHISSCGYVMCVHARVCKHQCQHCVQELQCFHLKSLCTFIKTAALDIWGCYFEHVLFIQSTVCIYTINSQHTQIFKAQKKIIHFYFSRENFQVSPYQ